MRSLAIAAPVLLAVQALVVHQVAGAERAPSPPDFTRFPKSFANWQFVNEDPITPDVQEQLHADRLLSRSYWNQKDQAGLFVAWFQSQRSGLSQPHSPQVCLPASGWVPEIKDEVTLQTTLGPIAVNRYVVTNRGQRDVVLYWYQMQRRAIEGEWSAKFWTVETALRDRRTDTALVRIVTYAGDGNVDHATGSAIAFGRDLYPVLLENFPR
jgi:EpsI family protein